MTKETTKQKRRATVAESTPHPIYPNLRYTTTTWVVDRSIENDQRHRDGNPKYRLLEDEKFG
jgi:hypothetical protein